MNESSLLAMNEQEIEAYLRELDEHAVKTHDYVAEKARKILRALYEEQKRLRPLAFTQLEKLSVQPGDVVVAKLGDRRTGWIPSPEDQTRFESLWSELCAQLNIDVPVFVWNFGVEFETIKYEKAKQIWPKQVP